MPLARGLLAQLLQTTASRLLLAVNLEAGQNTAGVLSLESWAEPASAASESAGGERAPGRWAERLRASAVYRTNTLGCQKALALLTWKWCVRPSWVAWDQTAPSGQTYIPQTTCFHAKILHLPELPPCNLQFYPNLFQWRTTSAKFEQKQLCSLKKVKIHVVSPSRKKTPTHQSVTYFSV